MVLVPVQGDQISTRLGSALKRIKSIGRVRVGAFRNLEGVVDFGGEDVGKALFAAEGKAAHIGIVLILKGRIGNHVAHRLDDRAGAHPVANVAVKDGHIDAESGRQLLLQTDFILRCALSVEIGVAENRAAAAGVEFEAGRGIEILKIGNLEEMAVREMDHPLVGNRIGDAEPRADLRFRLGLFPHEGLALLRRPFDQLILIRRRVDIFVFRLHRRIDARIHGIDRHVIVGVKIVEPHTDVHDEVLELQLVLQVHAEFDRFTRLIVYAAEETLLRRDHRLEGNDGDAVGVERSAQSIAVEIELMQPQLGARLDLIERVHLAGQVELGNPVGGTAEIATQVVAGPVVAVGDRRARRILRNVAVGLLGIGHPAILNAVLPEAVE